MKRLRNNIEGIIVRLDLTTVYFYLSKITSNLAEIYLSQSKITS